MNWQSCQSAFVPPVENPAGGIHFFRFRTGYAASRMTFHIGIEHKGVHGKHTVYAVGFLNRKRGKSALLLHEPSGFQAFHRSQDILVCRIFRSKYEILPRYPHCYFFGDIVRPGIGIQQALQSFYVPVFQHFHRFFTNGFQLLVTDSVTCPPLPFMRPVP